MSTDTDSNIKTDRKLLNAVRDGDDNRALSVLYKTLYPRTKHYIRQNGGTETDAEDIFQNAVIIFYKYVKQGKFKEEYEIRGFIYTVCKNLWIKEVRKRGKLLQIPQADLEVPSEEETEEALMTEEREELVRGIFHKMSERCRQIFYYAFYLGLNTSEIARKTGMANEDTVKSRKYKCKKQFIEYLKRHPLFKKYLKND